MIILDLTEPLLDLAGKPVLESPEVPFTLGRLLAQQLAQSSSGPALKFLEIALELHQNRKPSLTTDDFKLVQQFVESADNRLTVLARGRILKAMQKAVETSPK